MPQKEVPWIDQGVISLQLWVFLFPLQSSSHQSTPSLLLINFNSDEMCNVFVCDKDVRWYSRKREASCAVALRTCFVASNYIKQSRREASSSSRSQEIARILLSQKCITVLKKPVSCPCPDPDKSNPLCVPFYSYVCQISFFRYCIRTLYFSVPYVPHALPIISYFMFRLITGEEYQSWTSSCSYPQCT
jgi:hypothetical protein